MAADKRLAHLYEHLANREEAQGVAQTRDRYLILAADAALSAGDEREAERLRGRLLEHNPSHMLRPYASLSEAMQSADVENYIADLRGTYPPEEAERELARDGDAPTFETEAPEKESTPLRLADSEPAEAPEIYPFHRAASPEQTAADPAPPPVEAPLVPVKKGSKKKRPAPVGAMPDVYPYPEATGVTRSVTMEEAEPASGVNLWMSNFLFGLLLLAAVGLLSYMLARPFVTLE